MTTSPPFKADDPAVTGATCEDEEQRQEDYTLIDILAQDASDLGKVPAKWEGC